MSLTIVGFICFSAILGSISLLAFMGTYQQVIKDAYMNQMQMALGNYKKQFAGNNFNEDLYNKGQQKLAFITQQLMWITYGIVGGVFLASVFSTVMFLWGIVSLYKDFRQKALEMRKGIYPKGLRKIPLITVTPLTGYIFSNAFISFSFNMLIGTIIFFVFCWWMTYKWLWENKYIVLMMGVLTIWEKFQDYFIDNFIIDDDYIKSRRILGLWQLFELFTTIVTGVVEAF